jgi:N-methylhydantoinase B
VETTGGGGWGDPLDREVAAVELDLKQGKVSPEAAERDYGVVPGDPGATTALRARLKDGREVPAMFDRGPGYAQLAGGQAEAAVDR